MPGPLLHFGASAVCSHAGTVTFVPTNARVLVGGAPVLVVSDLSMIAGCTLSVSPCVTVQWVTPAARVLVNGQPALLQTSLGLGVGAAPQGPVTVVSAQPRVVGS